MMVSHARLVEDYVRAKWRHPGVTIDAETAGQTLSHDLKSRIDELGIDDQLFVDVVASSVFDRLDELEAEHIQEELCNTIGPR